MSKAPPIPREQRSFQGQRPDIESGKSAQGGDNTRERGAAGNLNQNVRAVHARVQDR